ncbi:MAG: hypothetical protein K2Y21_04425 [Phycisphaerales bacterium]|nr:hypothetical protein [Phycisphaerales bacterium]
MGHRHAEHRKAGRITGRELVSACTLVLALGMLIWLKLRLVANVPRTAYAQPTQEVEPRKPEPAKASPDELPQR